MDRTLSSMELIVTKGTPVDSGYLQNPGSTSFFSANSVTVQVPRYMMFISFVMALGSFLPFDSSSSGFNLCSDRLMRQPK